MIMVMFCVLGYLYFCLFTCICVSASTVMMIMVMRREGVYFPIVVVRTETLWGIFTPVTAHAYIQNREKCKQTNKQTNTNKETQTKKHCTKDCDTAPNKNISVKIQSITDRGPVRQAVGQLGHLQTSKFKQTRTRGNYFWLDTVEKYFWFKAEWQTNKPGKVGGWHAVQKGAASQTNRQTVGEAGFDIQAAVHLYNQYWHAFILKYLTYLCTILMRTPWCFSFLPVDLLPKQSVTYRQ